MYWERDGVLMSTACFRQRSISAASEGAGVPTGLPLPLSACLSPAAVHAAPQGPSGEQVTTFQALYFPNLPHPPPYIPCSDYRFTCEEDKLVWMLALAVQGNVYLLCVGVCAWRLYVHSTADMGDYESCQCESNYLEQVELMPRLVSYHSLSLTCPLYHCTLALYRPALWRGRSTASTR